MIWATAKTLCRLIHASGLSTPIVLILTEGGFTVVNSQWGIADVVVASASPAEVEGRLRLVSERGNSPVNAVSGSGESGVQNEDGMIHSGDLVVDTNGYTASLHGHPIDLAYKEFELLKYLGAASGARVHPRAAAAGSVGLRLLRRHRHRRRAYPSSSLPSWAAEYEPCDRYRAQCRLSFLTSGRRGRRCGGQGRRSPQRFERKLIVALFALLALPAICDACDCHDTCGLTVGYLTFVRAIAYSYDGRLVPCPGNRNKRDCHACIRNTPYCARRFRIRNAR